MVWVRLSQTINRVRRSSLIWGRDKIHPPCDENNDVAYWDIQGQTSSLLNVCMMP